jgi:hypothetical protein
MTGQFTNGRREFFNQESFQGRAIYVRFIFSKDDERIAGQSGLKGLHRIGHAGVLVRTRRTTMHNRRQLTSIWSCSTSRRVVRSVTSTVHYRRRSRSRCAAGMAKLMRNNVTAAAAPVRR